MSILTVEALRSLNSYMAAIARDGGVRFTPGSALQAFPVPPKTHERLISLTVDQDTTGFLGKINIVSGLTETEGKLLYGDLDDHVLKRSNPPTNAREPSVAASQTERTYSLKSTEADMMLDWEKLNAYARFPSFQETLRNQLALRIANDRLFVGWNGVDTLAYAPTAQIASLNKGWVQRMREERPENVISEIVAGSSKIFVGNLREVGLAGAAVNVGGGVVGLPSVNHGVLPGAQITVTGTTNYNAVYLVQPSTTAGEIHVLAAFVAENLAAPAKASQTPDYKNMDELAVDLVSAVPVHKRAELMCMLSDELRAAEKALLYGLHGAQPSEKVVIERAFENLAGYPVESPAFIPQRTLVATKHRNLSIYIHQTWNRAVENKHEWKGVVFWNEFTEGYFVEDPDAFVMAENIYRI
jgi:Phage major capsid protein, P2 family